VVRSKHDTKKMESHVRHLALAFGVRFRKGLARRRCSDPAGQISHGFDRWIGSRQAGPAWDTRIYRLGRLAKYEARSTARQLFAVKADCLSVSARQGRGQQENGKRSSDADLSWHQAVIDGIPYAGCSNNYYLDESDSAQKWYGVGRPWALRVGGAIYNSVPALPAAVPPSIRVSVRDFPGSAKSRHAATAGHAPTSILRSCTCSSLDNGTIQFFTLLLRITWLFFWSPGRRRFSALRWCIATHDVHGCSCVVWGTFFSPLGGS